MVFPRDLTPKGTGAPDFEPEISQVSGTIQVKFMGQAVMTGIDIQARYRPGTKMMDRIPRAPGSEWMGSWQYIENYLTKTYVVHAIGSAGSFAIVTGMMGTHVTGATGTRYGPYRIGAGSYHSYSFREAFRYTRPYFKPSGTTQNARGSFTVMLARQA